MECKHFVVGRRDRCHACYCTVLARHYRAIDQTGQMPSWHSDRCSSPFPRTWKENALYFSVDVAHLRFGRNERRGVLAVILFEELPTLLLRPLRTSDTDKLELARDKLKEPTATIRPSRKSTKLARPSTREKDKYRCNFVSHAFFPRASPKSARTKTVASICHAVT